MHVTLNKINNVFCIEEESIASIEIYNNMQLHMVTHTNMTVECLVELQMNWLKFKTPGD